MKIIILSNMLMLIFKRRPPPRTRGGSFFALPPLRILRELLPPALVPLQQHRTRRSPLLTAAPDDLGAFFNRRALTLRRFSAYHLREFCRASDFRRIPMPTPVHLPTTKALRTERPCAVKNQRSKCVGRLQRLESNQDLDLRRVASCHYSTLPHPRPRRGKKESIRKMKNT